MPINCIQCRGHLEVIDNRTIPEILEEGSTASRDMKVIAADAYLRTQNKKHVRYISIRRSLCAECNRDLYTVEAPINLFFG